MRGHAAGRPGRPGTRETWGSWETKADAQMCSQRSRDGDGWRCSLELAWGLAVTGPTVKSGIKSSCHSPRLVFIFDTPPLLRCAGSSTTKAPIKPSQYVEIGSLFRWLSPSTNPSTTSPDDTSNQRLELSASARSPGRQVNDLESQCGAHEASSSFVTFSDSMHLFCPSLDLIQQSASQKRLVQCRFLELRTLRRDHALAVPR
ncbi:hypothetical protein E4U31_003599 [Claviceps sp. LM219 group G6]|nr:hypothetical protein E4U31_003599 [Claviceps sp. LM219 group G6]